MQNSIPLTIKNGYVENLEYYLELLIRELDELSNTYPNDMLLTKVSGQIAKLHSAILRLTSLLLKSKV